MFSRPRVRKYRVWDRGEAVYNATFLEKHNEFDDRDFSQEILRHHNHYRAQHGCMPLHLSSTVSSFSQQWAETLSREDHFHHSYNPHYGENLFCTYLSDNSLPMANGKQVVDSWYSEHVFYPFGHITRDIVMKAGHFTQLVWSGSRELGVGRAVSRSNRVYVVANYSPAGNVLNKFHQNVPQRVHHSHQHYDRRVFTRICNIFTDCVR